MYRKERPLAGLTVAIPETRERNRLSALLVDQGAMVFSCPLISIRDVSDPAPVEVWLQKLCAGDFQDVIFMTGEGVTRLLGFAERAGLARETLAAISNVRTITRGPKPARALRQVGLLPTLPAVQPTTEGIIDTLAHESLGGRSVGVQLYGQEPNPKLIEFLEKAGALVHSVAPYVYLPASNDTEVVDLIDRLATRSIDAIAFTTRSQIDRLYEVAESRGLVETLHGGLCSTLVAAVGPLVVASLEARGIRVEAAPERSFFLRPLVEQLTLALAEPPPTPGTSETT